MLSEGCSIRTKPLVLHSDNGNPMKGASLLETLYKLGITSSKSRPRVSNDNLYAESVFRTCKYRPDFPYKGFATIVDARTWVFEFVRYYNHEHRHSGIGHLTPVQRHNGLEDQIFQKRTAIYEAAKLRHPERRSQDIRNWSLDKTVWLNPDTDEDKKSLKVAK
jgi:putative transposase